MGYTRLQTGPFSADAVLDELRSDRVGGINLYVGTVRADDDGRRVEALHYEAFAEMAQEQLERLRVEAIQRFGLVDAIVIHRTGRMPAREPILLVALAGVHRKETYEAMDHLMDRLKQIVPIWKQEHGPSGTRWILGDAHHGDAQP